jgi:nucleoside-diphosphate-sugar epimerase
VVNGFGAAVPPPEQDGDMRVLLTGASGFVGRHTAEALRRAGHDTVCLVRREADAERLAREGHAVVRGDVSDVGRLAEAVDGTDGVVHVAGLIAARSFHEMRDVNEGGTARLASACARAARPPRRFVLVSSLAAGGPSAPGRAVHEDDPARPVSRYGWSKLLGERAARRSLPGATALTIVRPPAVFGAWDRGIHAFFLAAARGLRPRIGLRRRAISMVHGPDLARGIVLALASDRAAGRTYHVADPVPVDLHDALSWIAEAVGRPTRVLPVPEVLVRAVGVVAEESARLAGRVPEFSRDKVAEFLAAGWVCDTARARDELGWTPASSLRPALEETARWYRANGWI